MTIDEAIKYCLEVAEEQSRLYSLCPCPCDGTDNCMSLKNGKDMGCTKCAADHRQLAEWLTELKEAKEKIESGDLSDGYHTFNQLYHQRAMLFATIVNQNSDKAWKTHKHEDGEPCFGGGWFLVTIDTPQGAYGYHYEDKYWNMFKCKELEKAEHWDGYTEEDVGRLFSLC